MSPISRPAHVPMRPIHLAISFLTLSVVTVSAQTFKYPEAAKKPVTDTYHGIQVVDDYRWLENDTDPAVKAWSLDQLKVTRAYLDNLPRRAKLKERFADL